MSLHQSPRVQNATRSLDSGALKTWSDCRLKCSSPKLSVLVQLARVGVCVIVLVDVICVMLVVLIAHVDIRAVYVHFPLPFSVVGDVLFTLLLRELLGVRDDRLFRDIPR